MSILLELVKTRRPLLQIALDLTRLEDAARIASLTRNFDNIVLEAGTPLIKSEGARCISILKAISGKAVIADTKTADVADIEAKIVAEQGGDAYTILATAPEEVIENAVKSAKRYNLATIADLIHSRNIEEDAEKVANLGVDIIELHVGIDVQRRLGVTAEALASIVNKLSTKLDKPIAVAGGLNPESIPKLVEQGASIVIVGGYIIKSNNPYVAIKECLSAIKIK